MHMLSRDYGPREGMSINSAHGCIKCTNIQHFKPETVDVHINVSNSLALNSCEVVRFLATTLESCLQPRIR